MKILKRLHEIANCLFYYWKPTKVKTLSIKPMPCLEPWLKNSVSDDNTDPRQNTGQQEMESTSGKKPCWRGIQSGASIADTFPFLKGHFFIAHFHVRMSTSIVWQECSCTVGRQNRRSIQWIVLLFNILLNLLLVLFLGWNMFRIGIYEIVFGYKKVHDKSHCYCIMSANKLRIMLNHNATTHWNFLESKNSWTL